MKTCIRSVFCLLLGVLLTGFAASAQNAPAYRLSTHILDINKGLPAAGVGITLYKQTLSGDGFEPVASGKTDAQGRISDFLPAGADHTGIYKLRFETEPYFKSQGLESIYPFVEIIFRIEGQGHYHIPLTMSANGYSTYRGN